MTGCSPLFKRPMTRMSTPDNTDACQIKPHPHQKGTFVLTASLWLPAAPEVVFPFFADPFNLEAITPPWLHFHILTPRPIPMQAGAIIDYQLRLHGLPLRWRTEISGWEPPFRFVDEQRRGPYALWHHEHTFHTESGGTRMLDKVHYRPRGGGWVHHWLVRPDLLKIFRFRQTSILRHFQGKPEAKASVAPTE